MAFSSTPSSTRMCEVLLIGYTGNVGAQVKNILLSQRERWAHVLADVTIVAFANSKEIRFPLTDEVIHLPNQESVAFLCAEIRKRSFQNLYILDCTASDDVTSAYPDFLDMGILITCNKRGSSGSLDLWREISPHLLTDRYRYEATVMAGLPVISTLRNLKISGDQIRGVTGVFSGTLSYIFNLVTAGSLFSESVRDAKRKGYTEPDPRDDLNGIDFARKLVVLGRDMGILCTLQDVLWTSDPIVPKEMESLSLDEFWEEIFKLDESMRHRASHAESRGNRLVYLGRVDAQKRNLSCGLTEVPKAGPFGSLTGSNNLIVIESDYYPEQSPMVISGPGAGAIVTASAMVSDLLRA